MIKPVLRMTRGDTKQIPFVVLDGERNPIDLDDLASITFTVKVKRSQPDEDALIVKTLDDGISIVDADAGRAMITIDPIDTDGFGTFTRGLVWDIQIVTTGGQTYTIIDGILTVIADVTQG